MVLGTDIRLTDGDITFSKNQDFSTIVERENLGQAISNRLKTVLGEYYNTNYGSEITKVDTLVDTDLVKNRIKGFIYECLIQDRRILTINSISVSVLQDTVYAEINITPNDGTNTTLTTEVTI